MSDTLALAGRLQAESDAALIGLLRARHLDTRDLRDFFDLADALLRADSIQDALSQLDRETLSLIAGASTALDDATPGLRRAAELMLVAATPPASAPAGSAAPTPPASATTGSEATAAATPSAPPVLRPYDAVTAVLESWPSLGLPSVAELAGVEAPTSPEASDRSPVDSLAAERAFEVTVAVTELTNALAAGPARELAKGGLAVPDAKRLAAATGLDADLMNAIIRVAERAGLVARVRSSWYSSEASRDWSLLGIDARWGVLASAWVDALPVKVAEVLRERGGRLWGADLLHYLAWLYPAGGTALAEQIDLLTADAERLGLAHGGSLSAAGAALLISGEPAAVATISPLLPPEVDAVYLQHDLTVVAPGPLRADLDATLRAMTQVESRSLASSYRFSAASIARALGAGYTADSIRSFLLAISSTGIPQPLDYLISESSARFGLLRVGSHAPTAEEPSESYIRSDDEQLLRTIAVDQNLSSLGLTFAGPNRLNSRFGRETVYWMLADARYPVIAERTGGEPVSLMRQSAPPAEPQQPDDHVGELVNRLRGSGVRPGVDTAEAWLVRQLDVAVKAKTPIVVTVRLPNGSEVSFPVVPTSIASGRMRGTDQKAGVERTLPLASITQVEVVGSVA